MIGAKRERASELHGMTNLRSNCIELSHQRSTVRRRLDDESVASVLRCRLLHGTGRLTVRRPIHNSSTVRAILLLDHRSRPGGVGVRHADQRERRRGRTRSPAAKGDILLVARDDRRVARACAPARRSRRCCARTTSPSPTPRPSSRRRRRCSICGRCAPTSRTASRPRTPAPCAASSTRSTATAFCGSADRRTRRWSRGCCRFRRRAASRW